MSLPARTGARAPAWLEDGRRWIEVALTDVLPAATETPARLHEAMRYALLAGGKRLRPALVRLFTLELGGAEARALRPALALELVHTYSLVHDDLPVMDDDALRRGRPTVHVAYDEATAILVGDGLLTLAFECLAEDEHGRAHVAVLARAAGSRGMVGGQSLDLAPEVTSPEATSPTSPEATSSAAKASQVSAAVEDMHRRKTSALFAAACEMGAIAAGCGGEARQRSAAYGLALGGLFQAVDDLLDVTGDAGTLGKTPGKDAALERSTLVQALGLEGARRRAAQMAADLRAAARGLDRTGALVGVADYLLERSS